MKRSKYLPAAVFFAAASLILSLDARAQSFVQANFNYGSNPSGFTDIATTGWPSFVSTPGNTVVVFVRCTGSATNTFAVNSTLTWQGPFYNTDGNNGERSAMFYIQPPSGDRIQDVDVTFSSACTAASIIALELGDVAGLDVGPVFMHSSTAVPSGTTASLTTTNANDILVMCADTPAADQTSFSAGSGYSLPPVATAGRAACEYKIVSSVQSGVHAGMGWSISSSYDTAFLAFKGSGSGTSSDTMDFHEGCNATSNSGTGTCGRWLVADGGTHGIAPYTFAPSFDPGGGFPMYAIISPTTSFQDDYFYVKLSAPDTTSHFTYCTNWQIPNSTDLTKFQAIETDFHQNSGGFAYTGGVQFNSTQGGGPNVRLFDIGTNTWHAVSGLTMPLTDTNWHSLCYSFTNDHTNHTTTYTSITIDGTPTTLSTTYNAKTTTDLPVIGVAVQLDGDSASDSYKLQVQNWTISFN